LWNRQNGIYGSKGRYLMAQNETILYVSGWSTILLGFGSHFGILFLAERNTDAAKRSYEKFVGEKKTLKSLEKEIDMEAWRWPIYSRPVFYTSIDQTAQVYFSNTQRAISQARKLEKLIYYPPDRPTSIRKLLSFYHNWQRLNVSLEIQKNITEFEKLLNEIKQQLTVLQRSHYKEERLQERTKLSLEVLEKQIEETGKRIGGYSRGKKYDENVDWAQKNTKNCYLEAQNQLTHKTSDGINFAISDLFIKLANYILDHFDLYEQEFATPARFELDHFEHHHELFRKCIGIMLDNAINDWYDLRATARMLELVDRQMQQSKRSLRIFLEKQQNFHQLEQEVQSMNFPFIIQNTEQVEKDCESYWGPMDQDPNIWTKVLSGDPSPRVSLDDARRSYQADIFPAIGADAVIKQSSIIKITENIQSFLQKIHTAELNKNKLLQELNTHKQAQIVVNYRLNPSGSTHQKLTDLVPIESDTSSEIQRFCISCRKDFEVFQARAQVVQGANFPEMLVELDQFEEFCIHIKQQHEILTESLRGEAYELVQQLIAIHSDISDLKDRRPRIEYDTNETNEKLILTINSFSEDLESYKLLRTYISLARDIMSVAEKDKNQLDKLWEKFLTVQRKTVRKLSEMEKMLVDLQVRSEESWAWAQKEYKKVIKPALKSYERHRQELEQLTSLDITIKVAVSICQRIAEEIGEAMMAVASKLQPIQDLQEPLVNRRYALESSTRRTTMFDSIKKNSDLIKEFCFRAEQSRNIEEAELYLDLAQRALEQSLSREDANRIINKGLYIENQSVRSGGRVNNAGRDIKQSSKRSNSR
jgi:hypothetical protein